MIRVVYISGKYRHWRNGEFDREVMRGEIWHEQQWQKEIASHGMAWIAPLANSVDVEGCISQEKFIEFDLALLRRLRPDYDVILMRPRWETSEGAKAELEQAKEVGLLVAQGNTEDIIEYLRRLGDEDETTLG